MSNIDERIIELLDKADVKVDGSRPQDIKVHDNRLYARVVRHRELGLGEAYMDGWWDCQKIDELVTHVLTSNVRDNIKLSPAIIWTAAPGLLNQQTLQRARVNAEHHYNIGNDLYETMLDKRMIYSCAYWKNTKTLDKAQENKLDLICRKLHLKPGMTILDIGCGWGGFAEFAATNYGAVVTGITPAAEQVKVAKKRTKGMSVRILQKDYREMSGKFDRIISVGMLEHVGPKNYKTFFEKCGDMLSKDGIMLHHTIGANGQDKYGNPFINKYIFPGGRLPSLAQISQAVADKFIIEDVHNFGPDYDKTLMAWYHNFFKHYDEIKDEYDLRFYRMWEFYLLICAGAFRSRRLQLWQIVMTRVNKSETYTAVR